MRKVELCFSPGEIGEGGISGKILVAVDVLRTCTTMVIALKVGARDIIPVSEIEDAKKLKDTIGADHVLLCGEREGKVIPGFDMGNSPVEFSLGVISKKSLIFCTTNLTPLLSRLKSFDVVLASFLNAKAVVRYLRRHEEDVIVLCAGKLGVFCLEDAVCSGYIISRLLKRGKELELNDGALAGLILFKKNQRNILGLLKSSQHGKYLISLGFEEDLKLAAECDSINIVPVFKDGRITR